MLAGRRPNVTPKKVKPQKRGPKPKPAALRRTVRLHVVMTHAEKALIEANANAHGMGTSTYLREQGLKGR
jgi:Mobilization protein NikA